MPATNVWHLDDAISYDIGGIHDPMGNAFHTALTANIPGAVVLITGCGPIGAFAVGICKAAGAARIIATDVNPKRLALARSMGAHDAVLPADAERAVRAASDGHGADVVLEMSGVPSAVHQAFALARPGGRVNMLGIPSKTIDIDFATEIIFRGLTIYGVVGRRMYDTWHQMTPLHPLRQLRPDAGHHASPAARSGGRGDGVDQVGRGGQDHLPDLGSSAGSAQTANGMFHAEARSPRRESRRVRRNRASLSAGSAAPREKVVAGVHSEPAARTRQLTSTEVQCPASPQNSKPNSTR